MEEGWRVGVFVRGGGVGLVFEEGRRGWWG